MGDGGTVEVLSRGDRHQEVLPPLGGHCRGASTAPPLLLAARCHGPPVGGPKQLGLPPEPTRSAAAAVWGGARRPQPLSDHVRHGAWSSPPHSNRKTCGWRTPHIASSAGAAAATQPQRI